MTLTPAQSKKRLRALMRPEWQRAIDEEVASCLLYGVWEECELPAGKQALPSRFVFERKRERPLQSQAGSRGPQAAVWAGL